jgi:serine-type D-Ala-D-Ala carboxypeptidase (penicillin-binding protein 5/6)
MRTLFLLAALVFTPAAVSAPPPPASAWLLKLDGKVVGAHAADRPLPPASLTKLMTALLWLQSPGARDTDAVVTVSSRAAAARGSRAGLRAGDRYRGSDLLAALLVASANDACLALAEHAAGSVESFVTTMNLAAQRLELRETRFANPCGHDAPGHVSSPRDLLKLAELVLAEPRLRTLVAQPALQFAPLVSGPANGGSRGRILQNSNALLGRLAGTRGVKTGYTAAAGKCVIALVERDGHEVLLVLLNARDRWWVAHGMVEQAFARLRRQDERG